MPGMRWTPEQKAELVRYMADGFSFLAISRKMGLTKGQVAGQADRLGLVGAHKNLGHTFYGKRKKRAPRVRKVVRLKQIDGGSMGDGCRFPMWPSHGRPTHEYCGSSCQEESPYCPEHHARCYFKPIPKAKLEAVA